MNVLYVSLFPILKNDPAAGGQLAYYYVKKIQQDKNINLKLLCNVPEVSNKIVSQDDNSDNFDNYYLFEKKDNLFNKIHTKLQINKSGFFNSKTVSNFIKAAKSIKKLGFIPDKIIFDWETTGYLYTDFKKIFPTAFFSVVEQDVTSQSLDRFYLSETNKVKRIYKKIVYKNVLRLEKKLFNQIDSVLVLSEKDKKLVLEISSNANVKIIVPYYHNYEECNCNKKRNNNILFFGYMARDENFEAAKWFCENVMPELKDFNFVILGGGADKRVMDLKRENIIITGFQSIEQLSAWMEESLCMVVPLLHGAGVKIKVLEAMSSGIPLLTNKIGIEGISASDKIHYIHCENSKDYIDAITTLSENAVLRENISIASRKFINETMNYNNSSYLD